MGKNHVIEIGSLFPMITSLLESFTKSERKVAEAVLKDPQQIIYASITDFAENVGVGDTTIIRFCRKLGFKGYQGFKMALAQEVSVTQNKHDVVLNEDIEDSDTVDTVIQKLYNNQNQALQETMSLLSSKEVVKAVDLLMESKQIHFYGVGSSGVTALDAKYKFIRIGLPVDCFMDGHIMAMDATLLTSKDTVVGISYSGSTKDTIHALELAKKAGAHTICITHHARSPITKYADVILLMSSKEGPLQGGAVSTKVAQLFVIDILYTEVFRRSNEAAENKKKTGKAIEDKLL